MINLHTKFEVFTFTHYEEIKNNENCRIEVVWRVRGHPRSPAMSPFDRAHTTSYAFILYNFRVIASYLLKSPILTYLTCIWRPRLGWPCSNFAETFGSRKLVSMRYRVALFPWFYVQPFWHNTGVWQTDGHTTMACTTLAGICCKN